ncbi:MAG: AAA family ATPase, partial [Dolichospermum sp.]
MLQRVIIKGFKSIKTMDLELRPLNILIGANGAGKSNLISFFKMLNEMMAGRLQQYIGISGYAQSLLHFGPKVTPQIEAKLEFDLKVDIKTEVLLYFMRLFHAAGDTLIFAEEAFIWKGDRNHSSLGAGHQETKINEYARAGRETAQILKFLINGCFVYHFHDTSTTARVRQSCYVGDNESLMSDAGNLAALLLRFREYDSTAYQRIVKTIRLIAPFFDDFDLVPRGNNVILNWREKGSDQVFGPHQFSDGTLRAICLITLLLQPEDQLPKLIIVDEPELGLHPYALNVLAAIFGKASY